MSGFLCSMIGATFSVATVAEVIRAKKGVTAYGNAQVSTSQSKFGGSSAAFDGTGDYLQVTPAPGGITLGTGNFTIEGWVYMTSTPITVLVDPPDRTTFPLIYWSGSAWIYFVGGNVISGGSATTNTWYHWAVVRNSGSTIFYVNGTQVGSTYTDTQNWSGPSYINYGMNGNGYQQPLTGYMDEMRISNTARYTTTFTPSTTPFVNDANTLLLIHANGTNATTFFEDDNGVRAPKGIQAIGNAQVDTAQSKFGGSSALFDGTGDYLKVSDTPAIGSGDFTVEFWLRKARLGSQETILDARGSGDGGPWFVHAGGPNQIYYYTASDFRLGHQTALSSTGVWYHVAYVRTSGSVRIYLDGVQSTNSYTDTTNYSNIRDWFIGSDYALGNQLSGHLDEIRVSNTARYTTTFTPSTTPFVNDANTLLLIHADGLDASTIFTDDNSSATKLDSLTSLSNVSWNWEQYNIYQLKKCGLDSTSRPVFLYAYREVSTNYARAILFRVNSDLTITQGTPVTVTTSAVGSGVCAAVDTDNNYGYAIYYKSAGGAYAKTFTIDLNNLTCGTPGSEVTIYATSDGGIVSADYAGGGRVHYFHRRGGQVSGNFYTTRSGTTLTNGTEIVGEVAAGTVYSTIRTFANSGSLYRHALISGNGSPQLSAMYWNSTSGSTASSSTAITWGTGSGIQNHHLVRLNTTNKFMILSSGATAVQVCAGTITWPTSGTTAPTVATGTPVTVIASANNQTYGAIDGFSDDTAYLIIKSGTDGRFYHSKVTASSNTLTVGGLEPIEVGSAVFDNYGFACAGVEAFTKKFIVAICDNTGSTSPDIIVADLT